MTEPRIDKSADATFFDLSFRALDYSVTGIL